MIGFDLDGTLCPKWWAGHPDQEGILARFALAPTTPSLQLEFAREVLLVRPAMRPINPCVILSARPMYLFYPTRVWLDGYRIAFHGAPHLSTQFLTPEEAGHWKAKILTKLLTNVHVYVEDEPIIREILTQEWKGVVLTPEEAIHRGIAAPIR